MLRKVLLICGVLAFLLWVAVLAIALLRVGDIPVVTDSHDN